MALDELVKAGIGVGFSIGAGLLFGYHTAGYDEAISAFPQRKRRLHRLLDYAIVAALGMLPQAGAYPSQTVEHVLSLEAGISGGMLGMFLGRWGWHRRNDSLPLLDELETRELEEYGRALKQSLLVSEKEAEETSGKYEPRIMKIARKKKHSPRFWNVVDQVRKEAVEYAAWHRHIREIVGAADSTWVLLIKGDRIRRADGLLYTIREQHLHSLEVTIEKARFFSCEAQPVQAHVTYRVDGKAVRSWDDDVAELAEEIVHDERIVVVTSGPGPLEQHQDLAFKNYQEAATEYLKGEYLKNAARHEQQRVP